MLCEGGPWGPAHRSSVNGSRNRLMRWRSGEMSGHDLALEPVLGEQRDYRLGDCGLTNRSSTIKEGENERDRNTAAETSATVEKRGKDWEELCAKFDEYKEKAKDHDKWKQKYDDLFKVGGDQAPEVALQCEIEQVVTR